MCLVVYGKSVCVCAHVCVHALLSKESFPDGECCVCYTEYIIYLLLVMQDANERLKPVPSIPGDRETLLRLLDRRQQEIDRLTGEPCNSYYSTHCLRALCPCHV